jgi:uncharacterized protein
VVPTLKRVRAIAGLLFAIVAGLAVWSFALEPASLTTRHYRLSIPHWHADLAWLRIAVLADLHVGSPFNGIPKLHEIVAITNELKPDLILIPGDFVIQGVIGGGLVTPEDSCNPDCTAWRMGLPRKSRLVVGCKTGSQRS